MVGRGVPLDLGDMDLTHLLFLMNILFLWYILGT